MSTPIINSQLDSIDARLDDIKDAIENLPFAGVADAVSDWLDDHPSATTTVQDGAITWEKLATDVVGPSKYVVTTVDSDASNSGQISIGCDFGIYDEMTILIYQSDTTNNGDAWSDGDSSYLIIRDASAGSAEGYIKLGNIIQNTLVGSKPVLIRAKRIPDAIIAERKYDNVATRINIIPRSSSYTDYCTWITLNANTGKVIKAGTKIVIMIGRTM